MGGRAHTKDRQKVHVVTMGCAKNLVDSEKLMAQLRLSNVELSPTIEGADVAVINTCGFIEAARVESIDAIIENVRLKSRGKVKKVFAMGCLSERYRSELAREIPELDALFGSNELPNVLRALGAEYRESLLGERMLTAPSHSAFLKISEGCDNPCSFCSIPLMRGKHISRSLEDIVHEAQLLADKGVKEIVVIGQDTTFFGLDSDGHRRLPEVLGSIAGIRGIEWVRLMYSYPSKFPLEVLEVMAGNPKICKYLDIPLQHVSDGVLRSMRRGISRRALESLLGTIRDRVPNIALRTTLIVGYPTETEREFGELVQFVEDQQFHRLGVFTYSREEGTAAYALGDPIPVEEKERRRDQIMKLQQEISLRHNEELIGKRVMVLVDRREGDHWVGRTERDAPEIDNEVYITDDHVSGIGEFVPVEIESVSEYDLYGRVERSESC